MESEYNRLISPPEAKPFFRTSTGLRFWLNEEGQPLGHLKVETEDKDIFMLDRSRDIGFPSSYLFCYYSFLIGFTTHNTSKFFPGAEASVEYETNRRTIFDVGVPYYDGFGHLHEIKEDNLTSSEKSAYLRRPRSPGFVYKEIYANQFTWGDFTKNGRTKFPNDYIRDEMLKIWLELFSAFQLIFNGTNLPEGEVLADVLPKCKFSKHAERVIFEEGVSSVR